ncbi:MerR family transcriptional regulator [Flexibacterium corallicola]|uniref:MerR family transcriptional regulator n=1 Tax=Flexibacterium corallicola TaxID=3037259 RepID=UPI00286F9EFB|nr:helix-turn-helix domain-containing protein [Pseudovibrio sp. M1P-2-3]
MAGEYSIGDLAKATGTKVQTIRYYEERGILSAPPRTNGGQRRYSLLHLKQLSFIRQGRGMGFSLDMVSDLLRLSAQPNAFCQEADTIATEHLKNIESQIERLILLRDELKHVLKQSCEGTVDHCRVLETLSGDPL